MASELIPVNSLSRHIRPFEGALVAAASDVIRSGYFVLGPYVARFEQEFAEYCGVQGCVGVANGTDALELSLRALGVTRDDCVVVAANAAMYGTSAVLACDAIPLFVDVLDNDSTLDPALLKSALVGSSVKAVIVTHLYGRLARIVEIAEICAAAGVALVEDCAQAHGASLAAGKKAGSFGDVASFSFYPTKNLGALGDGGAVISNDGGILERVRKLRQYGWTRKYTNGLTGGRNSRLDEIQACMLSLMLPKLDEWNSRRRSIANRYSLQIRNTNIDVPTISTEEYVGHLYVIQAEQRDALQAHLELSGIQTDIHYPIPDHRQPCHSGRYDTVSLPVTEALARTVLTLPCFPELTDDESQRVIEACNRF